MKKYSTAYFQLSEFQGRLLIVILSEKKANKDMLIKSTLPSFCQFYDQPFEISAAARMKKRRWKVTNCSEAVKTGR